MSFHQIILIFVMMISINTHAAELISEKDGKKCLKTTFKRNVYCEGDCAYFEIDYKDIKGDIWFTNFSKQSPNNIRKIGEPVKMGTNHMLYDFKGWVYIQKVGYREKRANNMDQSDFGKSDELVAQVAIVPGYSVLREKKNNVYTPYQVHNDDIRFTVAPSDLYKEASADFKKLRIQGLNTNDFPSPRSCQDIYTKAFNRR